MKTGLVYSHPSADEIKNVVYACRETTAGIIPYTCLSADRDFFCENVWLGKDGEKNTVDMVFNDGITVFYVTDRIILCGAATIKTLVYSPFENESGSVSDENIRPLHGKELAQMYALMSGTGTLREEDEQRYVFRVRTDNRNMTFSFGIYEKAVLVSAASVTGMNEKYGLIGDVFTAPSFRGKGYASALIKKCISRITEKGLVPVVYCEEKTAAFYKNLGFTPVE